MRDELTVPFRPVLLTLSAALALAGCGIDADYTLTLSPRTLASQEPFAGEVVTKALLRAADGTYEIAEGDALRPLEGDFVGVVVERIGGVPDDFNRFQLEAYGEVGPVNLSTGSTTREVLVSDFAVVGDMDSFAEPHHFAAAAMLPGGGVILAGGGDLDTGTTDDGIYWLRHPDTEAWRLDRVADLPGGRAGATANTVDVNGVARVLIAGGRDDISDLASNRRQAMLFDPLYERVGWRGDLEVRRSGHVSVVLDNGKVLLIGGWTDDGEAPDNATFEIFDPATRSLTSGSAPLDVPSVGLAVASIGPDGALVCGGGRLAGDVLTPVATCNQINLTGQVSEAADMLGPRMGHSLVYTHDDHVLLAGGIDQPVTENNPVQGITTASLYVPREDSWDQIGPMELRRVGGDLLPTGDGRYLAVGGADAWDMRSDIGTARDCNELFVLESFAWTTPEPCAATGRGAGHAVASLPEHGAMILTGYDPDAASGRAYGWIGFGPPLLPE